VITGRYVVSSADLYAALISVRILSARVVAHWPLSRLSCGRVALSGFAPSSVADEAQPCKNYNRLSHIKNRAEQHWVRPF